MQKGKHWNVILPSADDRLKLSFSCPYNSFFQFQFSSFLKKGFEFGVCVSTWSSKAQLLSWGLLSFLSSWEESYSSVGREDQMTNLGREMEGKRELTYGFESAGFIPPHFLIVRERCSADRGRESLQHTLIIPLFWPSRKRRQFTFFSLFGLCPKTTQVFCFMKIGDHPILHVKCQDTKWPFLSATSDVILLSFVAVHLISYKAEPDCLLKDMDVGLLLPSVCAGSCRW